MVSKSYVWVALNHGTLWVIFPGGAVVKKLPANAGDARDVGSILGSRRSPGVGNVNPLQYSCLENPMDRGAWQATVHDVTKSLTWLSDWAYTHVLFKYMLSCYLKIYPTVKWVHISSPIHKTTQGRFVNIPFKSQILVLIFPHYFTILRHHLTYFCLKYRPALGHLFSPGCHSDRLFF